MLGRSVTVRFPVGQLAGAFGWENTAAILQQDSKNNEGSAPENSAHLEF